ncbi:MAG: hypothetical protein C0617_13150 [Desulfuromonas sp.]|uniref:alpha/beta hydrolase family protein n=1 Tax=Desulfuromonas sp. TaxID=892 RepID=UPI000CB9EDCA|nr:alpha/beta family hydrolase [Desulfuromonas sp.]PLX82814.1 MAG: hypothetical protein C0617_13150 [Desulfuromonas sp.]
MTVERVTLPIDGQKSISAVLAQPEDATEKRPAAVLIAHGAGGNMDHEFIVTVAEGLTAAGLATLRFNFPFSEERRKAPDTPRKLYAAWRAAFDFMSGEKGPCPSRIVVSGKSMGGRIASQMVAEGLLPADGLILFGYPLHPPGKPEKLRDGHLRQVRIPTLFVSGTRDALCDLTLLKDVLPRLTAPWNLEVIEGGDHSFKVPKSSGQSYPSVKEDILERTTAWLEECGFRA